MSSTLIKQGKESALFLAPVKEFGFVASLIRKGSKVPKLEFSLGLSDA
jgi:hypothetical protein